MADVTESLAEIAGALRGGDAADAVDGAVPRWVAEPETAEALARSLALADAEGLAVAPRGGGTKLGVGRAPERVDLVVSTARLGRVLEHAHADLTVTVEAGCTMAALGRALAERGQRLGLDPPWPERATVGGVLSANDSGPLRTRFGSARNLVLGATLALADGTLARSGGKVVKNVAGYDLPKLATGALGTLGVLVSATFRLHPIPAEVCDATFAFSSAAAAGEFLVRVLDSRLSPACAQVRSAGATVAVDVRIESAAGAARSHAARLDALAVDGERDAEDPSVWGATERLRSDAEGALVLKVGARPADAGGLAEHVAALGGALVVQSDGVGFARFDGDAGRFAALVAAVRERAVYAVVFACPRDAKRDLDVWGPVDAALSQRVKAQFDPRGTLNRGRFVGGI